MKNKYIDILIVSLTIHVFSVNSKLLYKLNKVGENIEAFTLKGFNFDTLFVMVIALSYSLATISVLRISKIKGLVWIYAILDSLGVLLNYYSEISDHVRAVYFSIYTGVLIVSTLYLENPDYKIDQILEMKRKGVSQRDIAKKLDLSEAKVSRLIKSNKDRQAA